MADEKPQEGDPKDQESEGADSTEGTTTEPKVEGGQDQPETFSKDYVQQLRQEAANWRTKAQEAGSKVKEFEDASKSDLEKAQAASQEADARAKAAEEKAQKVALDAAVQVQAAKLGVKDPEVALALLPRDGIQFGEDGQPEGVETALKALIEKFPYLKGGGGSSNPTNPDGGKGALTMEQVKAMSPEQINARWDEVSKVLEANGQA